MDRFFVCFSPQEAWLHQAIAVVFGLPLLILAWVALDFILSPLLHAMGGDKTGDN